MRFLVYILLCLPGFAQAAVVLQYHHVDTTTPAITSTSPDDFVQHLDYLASAGFRIVPLAEIVANPEIEADNRIAITFDDAYANLLTNAVPLLAKRNWPFTIFVATEYVGQHGYLSWQDLRDIESLGGTLANHTHSHLHMLRLLPDESKTAWLKRLEEEILKAQQLLEKHLSRPEKHFAYPYGEYDGDILALIAELGFTGFGQQSGAIGVLSDKRLLPRYPLSGVYANFENFQIKAHTLALPVETPDLSPLVQSNPPPLTLEFPKNLNLRLDALTCYGPGGKTDLQRSGETTFTAVNKTPLPVGRSRYNCTMPVTASSRYYWFSQLWINKRADGSWYPE